MIKQKFKMEQVVKIRDDFTSLPDPHNLGVIMAMTKYAGMTTRIVSASPIPDFSGNVAYRLRIDQECHAWSENWLVAVSTDNNNQQTKKFISAF